MVETHRNFIQSFLIGSIVIKHFSDALVAAALLFLAFSSFYLLTSGCIGWWLFAGMPRQIGLNASRLALSSNDVFIELLFAV